MSARLGQDHWRAKLTDRDVDLIRCHLADRRREIARRRFEGDSEGMIYRALSAVGLSFRRIAAKFEVSEALIRAIEGERVRLWSGRTLTVQRKVGLTA